MSKKIVKLSSVLASFLAAIALGGGAARADMITFDFSGENADTGGGNTGEIIGPLEFFEDDGETLILRVSGYYFDGMSWQPTSLYRRNDGTNEMGLGVCSPADRDGSGNCPDNHNNGDLNELDNAGQPEMIVMEIGPDYDWVSVSLSSLDTNGGGESVWERGLLWGATTNADTNGLPADRHELTNPLWMFEAGDSVMHGLTGGDAALTYLFFEPIDWSINPLPSPDGFSPLWFDKNKDCENFNNDFLVNTAVLERPERVPEPGSLVLLLAGLGALGLTRKRD